MTSQRRIVNTKLVILNIIFLTLNSFLVSTYNIFYLQTVSGNITGANSIITNTTSSQELDTIMSQISNSGKPEDIATLAYIWGYPLVTIERSFNYFTNPHTPNVPGQGPANELNCAKELVTANFTDVVLPNEDTLYCQAWMNLNNEPLVLKVPPIPDRYYTFEFLDCIYKCL